MTLWLSLGLEAAMVVPSDHPVTVSRSVWTGNPITQTHFCSINSRYRECLVQVCNGIELKAVGLQFELYLWSPCGVTWDSS